MKITSIFAVILSAAFLTACSNSASVNESSSGNVTGLESSSVNESSSLSEASTVTEKKADFYAEIALNSVEFPKMTKVETAEEIDAFFEFNTANYADFSLYMNVMSVQLNRVFVVKPIDGKHDEVYSELEAYLEDLVRTGTYYPSQEASAMGSQMGETADGYIYIIVHEDGLTAVRAIENAVGG